MLIVQKRLFPLMGLALVFLPSGCITVGPDYQTPDVSEVVPAAWKWQSAEPRDDLPKGKWWKIYRDPVLNRLEETALANNQQIKAAVARVEQAAAAANRQKVKLVPDVRFSSTARRERTSGNLPTPFPVRDIPSAHLNTFQPMFTLNYEVDLWGRIRRGIESADAEFFATGAAAQNLQLSLTAEVAATYYQLRGFDEELVALRKTLELRQKSTDVIRQRFDAGTVPETDLARSRSQLASTRAELAAVEGQRAEMLDTLALLCGRPASSFELDSRSQITGTPPTIPAGLPLSLLERRPDIAAAERLVAARNADIGVATADFFPRLTLTGNAGYLSKDLDVLFTPTSKIWSIGPTVSLPITRLSAVKLNVRRAKAVHAEAVADYRQTILTAVKDVETSLTQIRQTGKQLEAQREALKQAARAADLISQSYERGAASFLEQLDADRTRLVLERQTALLKARQFIASIRLIKALGGRW